MAHKSCGACAGEGQAGRSMQLERKEVGRGTTNSGSKLLGLPVVFCATSLLRTLLYRATSWFARRPGHCLVRTVSPVPLGEAKKAPDHTDTSFVEKVYTIRIDYTFFIGLTVFLPFPAPSHLIWFCHLSDKGYYNHMQSRLTWLSRDTACTHCHHTAGIFLTATPN